ncbi:cyclic di-AMP binding protein CbpA [Fructilactobacillus fructivorans]|uniref:CBS domain-containing protein n=1 Tax=Fructilactobacillus fructivorans TaxID=1614 RepID=A0AAE6P1H6_9LACO|nr:cyclic di-AMP binding protein CbpA [Fructilactobacillus fructivorans]KRK57370.1 CBS domain-containing protein [Fructilactobacillus fructivorans]KRN41021.1 CBS domain-containing protein [Fructilactobacillus fructivorans]KRN42992.1 CBS domain-containing protein [Fructilactobacillus fructivorans]MCT0151406.1 CBS domain-containing protein [Fructilactobacillus fructivorans]MCT2866925.1 CBS domain-containing protein [Fructilactobacillus fructivorans]
MILQSLVKPKSDLITVDENTDLDTALKLMEKNHFRCIPVLDATHKAFKGNIYRMHIYKHEADGGKMSDSVMTLIRNETKFVNLNSAFFKVFFTIKDLPYIAILDEFNDFYGILTHTKLMESLSQSWNVKFGSYVISVISPGERGDLEEMAHIITRYTAISSVISLDSVDRTGKTIYRTMFTLPSKVTKERLNRIIAALERKGFKVPEVEDLKQESKETPIEEN